MKRIVVLLCLLSVLWPGTAQTFIRSLPTSTNLTSATKVPVDDATYGTRAVTLQNLLASTATNATLLAAITNVVEDTATSLLANKLNTTNGTAVNLTGSFTNATLNGNTVAPTPAGGDNDTSVATTAFVQGQRAQVPVVNYGAIPDDGLDDTVALNAACQSGLTVFLPAGIYDCTNFLNFSTRSAFVGEGRGTVLRVATTNLTDFVLLSQYSQLKNLRITRTVTDITLGTSAQWANTISAISLQGQNVIENVWVDGFPNAVEGDGDSDAIIRNLTASTIVAWGGDGLVMNLLSCNNTLVENLVASDSDAGVSFSKGGLNNRIIGMKGYRLHTPGFTNQAGSTVNGGPGINFGTATGFGLQIGGYARDLYFEDCVGELKVSSNSTGTTDQCVNTVFENFVVYNTYSRDTDRCIEFDGIGTWGIDGELRGRATTAQIACYITDYCIYGGLRRVRFNDNVFQGKAVYFQASADRNTLEECYFGTAASGGDVHVYVDAADDVNLIGNTFSFVGNTVAQSAGIFIVSGSDRANIVGNRFHQPSSFKPSRSIRLAGNNPYVANNRSIGASSQRFIDVNSGVTGGEIVGNVIEDASGGAVTVIDLAAGSSNVRVTGNRTLASNHTIADAGTANLVTLNYYGATINALPVASGGTGATSASAAATNLGLGTGDSPQFTAVNVGHATANTLSATNGTLYVEGNAVPSPASPSTGQIIVYTNSTWAAMTPGSSGIGGSTGSVDNRVLRADGTGGSTVQNSAVFIDDFTSSTANNVALRVDDGTTANISAVITPKGTGAFILGPKPDGTAIGGNARGSRAVDLALERDSASRVASGAGAFAAGRSPTASGPDAVAIGLFPWSSGTASVAIGGQGATATGNYGVAIGGLSSGSSGEGAVALGGQSASASGRWSATVGQSATDKQGQFAASGGSFSTVGDSQIFLITARNSTASTTPTVLFLDGSSARITIPNNTTWTFTALLTGATASGAATYSYRFDGVIVNAAGTTSMPVAVTKTVIYESNAAADADATANNTNDSLDFTVTAANSTATRWSVSVTANQLSY